MQTSFTPLLLSSMDFYVLERFLNISMSLIGTLAAALGTYFLKIRADKSTISNENAEITREVNRIADIMTKSENDVLALMIRNVAELREYYVINKQQATKSFSAALIISIAGFLLFAGGIALTYAMPTNANAVPYSTIGGVIVEVIAGLFFWLYSKAIKQINIFHTSLQSTEKFLTAIQLVDKMSPDKKDDSYKQIIDKIIESNFSIERSVTRNS